MSHHPYPAVAEVTELVEGNNQLTILVLCDGKRAKSKGTMVCPDGD